MPHIQRIKGLSKHVSVQGRDTLLLIAQQCAQASVTGVVAEPEPDRGSSSESYDGGGSSGSFD